jgi:hypothetical protein
MSPQTETERLEMQGVRYRHAVGHLLYAAIVTRFDVMNAVRELSRFMEAPGLEHWGAAKRIMRYIKSTLDFKLTYGPFPVDCFDDCFTLVGFSDSDWCGCIDTRRSTTGYAFFFGNAQGVISGGAFSVNSRLQPTVALSSTEAEYLAACSCVQEAVYLRMLLADIGVPQLGATRIWEDNQATIALVNSALGQWNPRTRHIDVRYHFIKERVRSREVELAYVPSGDQVADVLTKNLGTEKFRELAALILGIRVLH